MQVVGGQLNIFLTKYGGMERELTTWRCKQNAFKKVPELVSSHNVH